MLAGWAAAALLAAGPAAHPAARRGTISLGELAGMDVIHGPRAWSRGSTMLGRRSCARRIRALRSPIPRCGIRCR